MADTLRCLLCEGPADIPMAFSPDAEALFREEFGAVPPITDGTCATCRALPPEEFQRKAEASIVRTGEEMLRDMIRDIWQEKNGEE